MAAKRLGIRWSVVLVYLSLLFVGIWLYRSGELYVLQIHNGTLLALSLLLALAGFVASAAAWWRLLSVYGNPVSFRLALASVGLTIFGKYIPGKVWALMGRATYIAEHSEHALTSVSSLSVTGQMLFIWLGLLFGAVTLLIIESQVEFVLGALLAWFVLSALLLSNATYRVTGLFARLLKRPIPRQPRLRLSHILGLLPYFTLIWLCWIVGFSLFVSALTGNSPNLGNGLAFALAASLGILAVIAPGGLGVREAILATLLVMLGCSTGESTSIAVNARLWFLAGEVGIFLTGLACQLGQQHLRTDGTET